MKAIKKKAEVCYPCMVPIYNVFIDKYGKPNKYKALKMHEYLGNVN